MKLATLQKLGGYAVIAGALIFTVWAVCWNFLLPVEKGLKDFSIMVTHPNWIWISALAFPGIILTIFGFTAIYSRVHEKSGWVGFIGYLFITVAYVLQASELTWEIFLYPAIASYGPSLALFRDNILHKHPMVSLFANCFDITILLGVLFFGTALIRSREFPKSGGILFLTGVILYAAGSLVSVYLALVGVLIFAMGSYILGLNLVKTNGDKKSHPIALDNKR